MIESDDELNRIMAMLLRDDTSDKESEDAYNNFVLVWEDKFQINGTKPYKGMFIGIPNMLAVESFKDVEAYLLTIEDGIINARCELLRSPEDVYFVSIKHDSNIYSIDKVFGMIRYPDGNLSIALLDDNYPRTEASIPVRVDGRVGCYVTLMYNKRTHKLEVFAADAGYSSVSHKTIRL